MASNDTLLNKETEQVKVDTVDHRTYPAGEHGEEKTTTENIQVVHEQVVPPPQDDEHNKVDSAAAAAGLPAHAATPGIFAGAAASIASTYQSAKDFAFSSTTNNTHNTDEDTLR
ncbi:hypothetical protein C5167_010626 [Papaver somniferum]|uniref:Uncharacterized protein n=1 Tax=Papaver somniferum TaxID=3469 RepID=A0A4Y7K3M6_PAPSO|nr:uncharacterized protein LOC113289154 [Papaver somniferum]RZC66940.1 hypothetical protein C5167_010626 [Papaver somniferum]